MGRYAATQVAFKNFSSFTRSVTKIYGTTIDDAEDFDLVMLMNDLLKYSNRRGSLWFYSKEEATSCNDDIVNSDAFKSFKYKAKRGIKS